MERASMQPVNYDVVASVYERRWNNQNHDGIEECLRGFVSGAREGAIAEVGCGTGHWLDVLSHGPFRPIVGLDRSARMLERARVNAPAALIVRGTAAQLPWSDASFDRVFCVNALHHFQDRSKFFAECRRVLRPGGGVLSIGLDPHRGIDQWWVYDYFPAALVADRLRYQPTAAICGALITAGFRVASTEVAQYIPAALPFDEAETRGLLDRRATSQTMVISDEEFASGLERLRAERPVLRADLRLYATIAWL
jgi:ubiquinone/menaquinone biosynthesis C-methylase UbiE